MLIVESSKPCAHAMIEFDPYIPFEIKLDGTMDEGASLWWRAGSEDKKSLVEVRVHPTDCRIQSVTVVLIAPGAVVEPSSKRQEVEQVQGVPCVDRSTWPMELRDDSERYADENCPVVLTMGKDSAQLWFAAQHVVERWYSVGQARFGVQDDALVCVEVCGLSQAQLAQLRAAIVSQS